MLHITGSIGRKAGGLGPIAIGLAEAHAKRFGEAEIWTLDEARSLVQADLGELPQGMIVCDNVIGPLGIGYSPFAERRIRRRGREFDVLHQHGIWLAQSRITNLWRRKNGKPAIVAPQGALDAFAYRRSRWKKEIAWRAYEGCNLMEASCLQATSVNEMHSIRSFGLSNPIAVIPNGISARRLNEFGSAEVFAQKFRVPRGERIALFLSRIHPKKGLPLLLRSLAQIKSSFVGWKLIIGGYNEVNHQAELEVLCSKLGLGSMIQFVGPLFGQSKLDAFAAADFFVLPTHSEGAPVVVLESLASGVPVLTTKGTPWEALIEHQCGWWVDIDVDALSAALLQATAMSSSQLRAMGAKGRELVSRQFTWEKIAGMTNQLYTWLAGNAPKPNFVTI